MNLNLKFHLMKYFHDIRIFLPLCGYKERRYLRAFRYQVTEYVEANNSKHIHDVIREFGTARDVAGAYLVSMDTVERYQYLRRWNHIRKILAVLLLVVVIASTIAFGVLVRDLFQSLDGIVVEEETLIE